MHCYELNTCNISWGVEVVDAQKVAIADFTKHYTDHGKLVR